MSAPAWAFSALPAPATAAPAPATGAPPPVLNARAAALMDANTGTLLYGVRDQQDTAIASTTKLMTALVTLERARLSTVFSEPDYYPAAVDSQIGLRPGERMTVHDLMLALLLPSADDAAEDLAYNVGGGSVPRFIGWMNARARQLGLLHTHYTTPIGLDTPGNYSTAADLVRLARYVLATEPFVRSAVAASQAELRSGDHPRLIVNRNDLVGRVRWINGVKTGHTLQAGYVLVGSGTRGGLTLISAVLGTTSQSDRDTSTLALLRWGFATFRLRTLVRAGTVAARLPVRYRPHDVGVVVAATTLQSVLPRTTEVVARTVVPRRLQGPLARGARVGTLRILAGGRLIARVPLVLAGAVAASKPPSQSVALLALPITLVSAALLALAAAVLSGFGRKRARGRAAMGRRET